MSSLLIFLSTVAFNIYQVAFFHLNASSSIHETAYIAGERTAIFTLIPIFYMKEPIWSLILGLITCGLRMIFLVDEGGAWGIVNMGVFFFLLWWIFIVDRRNITRNYMERDRLQQYSNTLRDIVENYLPEGIMIILEKSKQIVFKNKSFIDTLGNNCSALKDLDHLLFTSDQDATETYSLTISQIISEDGHVSKKSTTSYIGIEKLNDGEIRKYNLKVVSTAWGGQDAFVLIFHDITQQQQLLDLQANEKYKDYTIAVVSHELRTPLNGMLGMLQCLDQSKQDPHNKECIEVCINSGKLLLNLINSILDYDQIKNQKIKFNFESLSLRKLLDEIKHPMSFLARQKGLDFVLIIEEGTPEIIYTDKNRLQQIITNLIGNAIKFTFKGSITLHVALDPLKHGMIEISVKDTGVGISQDQLKNLFQRYGKLEDTKGINKTGVGLGLNISQSLVIGLCREEDTRGIRVSSVDGEGTTFTFSISFQEPCFKKPVKELPFTVETGEDVFNESLYPSNPLPTFSNNPNCKSTTRKYKQDSFILNFLSIMGRHSRDTILIASEINNSSENMIEPEALVVDDSPFNLLVISKFLREYGIKVSTAHHGLQCLELVKEKAKEKIYFSAIFLDCDMPVMDGYEAARELKRLINEKEISEIPIIALTANDSEEERRKCLEAGMDEFLSKPLTKQSLERIIKEYQLSLTL